MTNPYAGDDEYTYFPPDGTTQPQCAYDLRTSTEKIAQLEAECERLRALLPHGNIVWVTLEKWNEIQAKLATVQP